MKKVLTMRNIQTKRKKDIKNNHSTKSDGVINKGPANPMMELAGPFIFVVVSSKLRFILKKSLIVDKRSF